MTIIRARYSSIIFFKELVGTRPDGRCDMRPSRIIILQIYSRLR